ncbi:NAD(P)-binding domain-containing protein, partial [Acinetobacter baumannii]
MVDVLVVGAGPVGLAAGIEAKRQGLSHLILERGTVAETIYRFPRQMVFFSESKNLEIGGHPLVSQGPKPTRLEALLYYQKVAEREG